jgi:integrase
MMGRRPKSPKAIPRLRVRKKPSGNVCYYYDHGGRPRKETPLGSDYGIAIKRWAEFEHASAERVAAEITFRFVCDRYRVEVVPTKALATQRGNLLELAKLLEFFDDPPGPLEAIEPQHVRQYMRWREPHKIRATREKALLSHIWNWSREKGYTALANPCAGIKGTKAGREVYVENDAFHAVYKLAGEPLRDAMDMLYLTGQRPGDALRMDETHIRDGFLHVGQSKTGAKLRIEIVGELAALIERIKARKRTYDVYATRLLVAENGRPITLRMLTDRFAAVRLLAGIEPKAFQLRDLRAKAATDKAAKGDVRQAQKQLGHTTIGTTEGYLRNRIGDKVTPTR